MDKETLSNYGWIVVMVLVLVCLLAMATPFGKFISTAVKSTTVGLFQTSDKALGTAGIDVGDIVFEDTDSDSGTDTPDAPTNKVIPDGAKYTKADGTTLEGNGTNEFPDVPATKDTYEEGDYIYTYNVGWDYGDYGTEWSVKAKTDKESYGKILSEIAGRPVTHLTDTFAFYSNIKTAPEIPNSITSMNGTFRYCENLTTAPATIPDSVTDMGQVFSGCSNLTTVPILSSNVTTLEMAFSDCTSLTTAPIIPNSVKNMSATFSNCSSLTTAPDLPSGVENLNATFAGCTSLTTAPVIPESATNLLETFNGCTSLTGTIEINANPFSFGDCLKNTQITGITGSCSQETKDALIATKG